MGNSYRTTDKGLTYETIYDEDESSWNDGKRGPRELFSVDFSRQNPDFGFASDERNKGDCLLIGKVIKKGLELFYLLKSRQR